MFEILVLLCSGTFLLFYLLKNKRPHNFPPGPMPVPLFGNVLQLNLKNPLVDLNKISKRYGKVYSLYIGRNLTVFLHGYEAVKEILISHGADYAGRPQGLLVNDVTEYRGISMVTYGTHWKEHKCFTLSTLRDFGLGKKLMESKILSEAAHLIQSLEKQEGLAIYPHILLENAVSNVVCSVILGLRFDYDNKLFHKMMELLNDSTKILNGPWGMLYDALPFIRSLRLPFRRAISNKDNMKDFFRSFVKQHRKNWVPGDPQDYIDCYFEEMEKRKNNNESIFDENSLLLNLIDLFSAGTESTAITIRWTLLYLMRYPDVQARCHKEIDCILGSKEQISYEDRHAMPYMLAVIHESQRMGDVAPLGVFHAALKDTQLFGYTIPKGTTVIPNLSSVLHDDTQWKFPHEFNPSNFLNEKGEFVKPEAFVPFSAGPRICLGEALARTELFLFLTTLLRRFEVIWPENCGAPDLTPLYGITQEPQKYKMKLKSREN
ncbi:cytochrome P450 2F2-like isoform X2 [Polypterus senegalus]|uniref:cytochrome P450 2F2-like isoform X2 n=1 Tax=Polypterus senegalus TaxID=55291 RepID=UPI001966A39E|nr:cytochrome P450 2F2-like isoform X2 [Polypterus senegalus]